MTPATTLLIVEDEGLVAADLRRMVQNFGYEVAGTVATGDDAITITEDLHVDLVLMDIVLRGQLDGIQTAIKIRSKADTPILFLTAFSDEATLKRAKPAEPYAYLVKPIIKRDLQIAIMMALNKHAIESARQADPQLQSTQPTANGTPQLGDSVMAAARSMGRVRGLTHAELKVLELLVSGFGASSMAIIQERSIHTINFHIRGIYRKLRVESKSDLFRVLLKTFPA